MNLLLQDDLSVINDVVDEVRTVSNALYKYVDDLHSLRDEQINPDYQEELKGTRKFTLEDDIAISSMSKTICRLCLIVKDSLDEVADVLCKFDSPDRDQLKSVVFDKLYRGL